MENIPLQTFATNDGQKKQWVSVACFSVAKGKDFATVLRFVVSAVVKFPDVSPPHTTAAPACQSSRRCRRGGAARPCAAGAGIRPEGRHGGRLALDARKP